MKRNKASKLAPAFLSLFPHPTPKHRFLSPPSAHCYDLDHSLLPICLPPISLSAAHTVSHSRSQSDDLRMTIRSGFSSAQDPSVAPTVPQAMGNVAPICHLSNSIRFFLLHLSLCPSFPMEGRVIREFQLWAFLGASLVAQRLKHLQCGRPGFDSWVKKIPWRRKWQPTLVFLAGESHGGRSLVGYSPQGHKESDTTERLHFHFHMVKNLPAMQETRVRSLGQEDPLEKGMATHSSFLAWRMDRGAWRATVMGSQRDMTERLNTFTFISFNWSTCPSYSSLNLADLPMPTSRLRSGVSSSRKPTWWLRMGLPDLLVLPELPCLYKRPAFQPHC